MWAGVENHENVHLCAKLNKIASLGVVRTKAHAAILRDVNTGEEIHIGREVARAEPPLAHLDQETVPAVLVIVVALFLVTRRPVPRFHQFGVGSSADRVVPANLVLNNGT